MKADALAPCGRGAGGGGGSSPTSASGRIRVHCACGHHGLHNRRRRALPELPPSQQGGSRPHQGSAVPGRLQPQPLWLVRAPEAVCRAAAGRARLLGSCRRCRRRRRPGLRPRCVTTPALPPALRRDPYLEGVYGPVTAEVHASELEVIEGAVPADLSGAFVRAGRRVGGAGGRGRQRAGLACPGPSRRCARMHGPAPATAAGCLPPQHAPHASACLTGCWVVPACAPQGPTPSCRWRAGTTGEGARGLGGPGGALQSLAKRAAVHAAAALLTRCLAPGAQV